MTVIALIILAVIAIALNIQVNVLKELNSILSKGLLFYESECKELKRELNKAVEKEWKRE